MTTPPPRLEVQNLTRVYDGKTVVDDVSLTIGAGQVTCLLGPSGCGKSTTLRMIAGVDMQDSGRILVDGNLVCDTVFRIPPERRSIWPAGTAPYRLSRPSTRWPGRHRST